MGAKFKLKHANIMAYITSRSYGAPRVIKHNLYEFINTLVYKSNDYLIPEHGYERWSEKVSNIAKRAVISLDSISNNPEKETFPSSAVEKVLEELRSELSNYSLYALAIGNDKKLKKLVYNMAREPIYGEFLALIPQEDLSNENFEVLDPIPAFSVALHAAADWPGIVFWTPDGVSAFAPLNQVEGLWSELQIAFSTNPDSEHYNSFHKRDKLDSVLRRWEENRSNKTRRLLHLSDLHFGTTDAIENQPLLDAELRDVVKSVDRVVITGDLFNTPKKDYATLFTTFKNNITHLAGGLEPIAITGNHDQRMIGLFGDNYKQVALIGSTKVIVDDNSHMIFICFNSSEKGSLARGKITASQFKRLGAEYRTLTSARPELKEFLPIILVHHHPFSFDVPPATLVQRAFSALGVNNELFLEMEDAEDLHHWCLDWNIKTILHGHKHKARYEERTIEKEGRQIQLTAIGCGSSLGAEGSAVSYNLLEWAPSSKRWIASFYESVNGGGFREITVSVSNVKS